MSAYCDLKLQRVMGVFLTLWVALRDTCNRAFVPCTIGKGTRHHTFAFAYGIPHKPAVHQCTFNVVSWVE